MRLITPISKSATPYRPAVLMKTFVTELGTFARGRGAIDDDAFRTRFHHAFEHARAMFMGDGDRLIKHVATTFNLQPRTILGWTEGRALPAAKERRKLLKHIHSYLKVRYA